MTVVDEESGAAEGGDAQQPERPWRGVRMTGCDLRISNLSIQLNTDGSLTASPVRLELRTDMWPFWLQEAIEGAVAAAAAADLIPAIVSRLDTAADANDQETVDAIEAELDVVLFKELRASMRAISACAFAIDGFYAAVKARSPRHPQQDSWNEHRTSRHAQVTETIRHHLKITNNAQARELKRRVSRIYMWRDWAVHPGSKYKEAMPRQDIRASLDWHFCAFRAQNATEGVGMAVALFDGLVAHLTRGSEELSNTAEHARKRMNAILDEYESHPRLPAFRRVEVVAKVEAAETTSTDVSREQ